MPTAPQELPHTRPSGSRLAPGTVVLLLALLVLALFVFALTAGDYELSPQKAWEVVWTKIWNLPYEGSRTDIVIVWNIRLPRLLLAVLSGMALAASGTVYQACFRNPLVEPYLLGVSSGAAWGAALAIVFPSIFINSQLSAFVFALLAVLLSYMFARNNGETRPITLILSGIIVGALFNALVSIMKYLAEDTQLREITFWMMGGFYYATWDDVLMNAALIVPSVLFLLAWAWKLNLLCLGDDEARSLGIQPDTTRLLLLAPATLAAATCVSTVGIIAWVGLMMPHAARMLFGVDNRLVLPCAAMLGSAYLLLCDTLARTLTSAEIPIAIITSLVGAPYLLWLLRSKGKDMYAA